MDIPNFCVVKDEDDWLVAVCKFGNSIMTTQGRGETDLRRMIEDCILCSEDMRLPYRMHMGTPGEVCWCGVDWDMD